MSGRWKLGAVLTMAALSTALPTAGAGAFAPARPTAHGISADPAALAEPHWACPHGLCDAIVDPRPSTPAGAAAAVFAAGKPQGGGEEGGIDPEELRDAYSIPVTNGPQQTIAVVEAFSYPHAERDLAKYRAHYHLAPCTSAGGCLRIVNAAGEPPAEAGFTEWEPEVALDLDMASAACPECRLLLVSADEETFAALGAAENRAAAMGATEISNSFGLAEGECPECLGLAADWNHPGIFVSVSAGDYGYDNELVFSDSPSFPASLPTVAAVGGTALRRARGARGFAEKVWGERALGVGSGSGCSAQPKPAWQHDEGCAGRTENDIAAVGACATPVSVFDSANGGWIDLCGTSVSSPLLAGIEAHASAATRALPGGSAFYRTGLTWDVKSGADGRCAVRYLCHAQAGYDGPSGNGTPHGPLP